MNSEEYSFAVAFIFEGATEKCFYLSLLEYLASIAGADFSEVIDDDEIYHVWTDANKKVLIKYNVVGTITQITNSHLWFKSKCANIKTSWTAFLCYDTDDYKEDVSKFYEGDWKTLRKNIGKKAKIIDLAANADIEDVFLVDLSGVCAFIGIEVPRSEEIIGRKGKPKLKRLFRKAAKTYHEGQRAKDLICALNMDYIIKNAPVKLEEIQNILL